MQTVRLTTREVAELIQRKHGGKLMPLWRIRRVVDDLESKDLLSVQRAATYRTIADSDVHIIVDELNRMGLVKAEAAPCSA